jgi:copper resistance protein D
MTGFVDVLLRGLMLVGGAVALGGVVFALVVLRAGPGIKPDRATVRALRLAALGAGALAVAQMAIGVVALGALVQQLGAVAATSFALTPFASAALVRLGLAVVTVRLVLALARRAGGRVVWITAGLGAAALVASAAAISHAVARVEHRAALMLLDGAHQLAGAIWVGGLLHLMVTLRRGAEATDEGLPRSSVHDLARRFSMLALTSVAVLIAAGLGLTVAYVGDPAALVGTAYGVMVLTKVALLAATLAVALVNFTSVRRAAVWDGSLRLGRLVEVEAGLAVTVLFAAASLTSLPPAADVADRATVTEVAARFAAMPPRLASPDIVDLLHQTKPLTGGAEARLPIEREWSEFNHHWAGLFVLAMGLAAIAHRGGVRAARHWPLLLVALAAFLFVRNDPEVWPLGPIGFWTSFGEPEILQHRVFMILAMTFGLFEWAVRAEMLTARPWAYVFPTLCAVGGGLLLTHSHAVVDLKEAFLMEVTHAPIGVLGAFAGWARWLELRLPAAEPLAGRVWPACLTAIGLLLLVYQEG